MSAAIPTPVVEIRRSLCAQCKTPCPDYSTGAVRHADPCYACPINVWGTYIRCVGNEPPVIEEPEAPAERASQTPPAKPAPDPARPILQAFFSETGTEPIPEELRELHAKYTADQTKLVADNCTGCQLNGLKMRYAALIRQKLAEKNIESPPQEGHTPTV